MLTGKIKLLLFVFSFVLSGCYASDIKQPLDKAWWVPAEFNPTEVAIKGVSVLDINPEWKYGLVLDTSVLKSRLSKDAFQKLQQSNLKFKLEINIDNTPENETFFVGTYITHTGVKGRYIAILRHHRIVKIFTHSGFAGYSSIYLDKNTIRWYKCMECGDYDSIVWTGSDYIIK